MSASSEVGKEINSIIVVFIKWVLNSHLFIKFCLNLNLKAMCLFTSTTGVLLHRLHHPIFRLSSVESAGNYIHFLYDSNMFVSETKNKTIPKK